MAVFPSVEIESTVQVNDRTRIDASKSFASKGEAAISLVEIDPEGTSNFVDVTGSTSSDWFIDWEYSTEATYSVSVRVTTDGLPVTKTKDITVLSEANDKLFSSDSDLTAHEPDILNYVPTGRNSYKNIHRRAQERILAWLDERGYTDSSGDRLTKAAIVDTQEVKEWSTFMVLKLIFEGLSNSVEDIFATKAKEYQAKEDSVRHRLRFRADFDGDGEIDNGENFSFSSVGLYRR